MFIKEAQEPLLREPPGSQQILPAHHLLHQLHRLWHSVPPAHRGRLTLPAHTLAGSARYPPGILRSLNHPACVSFVHRGQRHSAGHPCSGLHRRAQRLLCPRLTSARPSRHLAATLALRQTDRPPGVRRVTFAPYTRCIYARPVRVASGFGSLCPLAHRTFASYAVRIPRTRALPAASFPRYLAITQLLFG